MKTDELDNISAPGDGCGSVLRSLLVAFIERGVLSEALYLAAQKAAAAAFRSVGREIPDGHQVEAINDLAMDFLIHRVQAARLTEIETMAGLKVEVIRYLTARDAPEHRELWMALSEAIRDLARKGDVRRLDGDPAARVTNASVWSMSKCPGDVVFDAARFRHLAADVGMYYPAREGGRILSVGLAKELILTLLEVAAAPTYFGALQEEASHHVVFTMKHQAPVEHENENGATSGTEAVGYRYDVSLWLEDEACMRADIVWSGSDEVDHEGHRVLCRYFLPKYFLNHDVTLSSIGGDFRRHSERGKEIKHVFARALTVDNLKDEQGEALGGLFADALASLTGRVAVILMEKCSEKFTDLNFSTPEPGTTQGTPL